jgi:hypothetical protein
MCPMHGPIPGVSPICPAVVCKCDEVAERKQEEKKQDEGQQARRAKVPH